MTSQERSYWPFAYIVPGAALLVISFATMSTPLRFTHAENSALKWTVGVGIIILSTIGLVAGTMMFRRITNKTFEGIMLIATVASAISFCLGMLLYLVQRDVLRTITLAGFGLVLVARGIRNYFKYNDLAEWIYALACIVALGAFAMFFLVVGIKILVFGGSVYDACQDLLVAFTAAFFSVRIYVYQKVGAW